MSAFWHHGSKSFVRSILFFDANDLHFADSPFGDKGAYLELAVLAVDGNGQIAASSRHRLRLTLTPAQYDDALKHGVVFRSRLVVDKPGAYQIRAAVRDLDSGRLGSGSQFLEVPRVGKGKLALSGVLLKGFAAETTDTAKDGTIEVSSGLADDALLAPTVRILKPGTKAIYAYEIYNGLGDEANLQMSTTLLRNGKAVYHSPGSASECAASLTRRSASSSIGGSLDLGADMPSGPVLAPSRRPRRAERSHRPSRLPMGRLRSQTVSPCRLATVSIECRCVCCCGRPQEETMRRLCFVGLLVLALVPLSARQQDPAPQPGQPIFKTSSTLATLDAVVTDDDGRAVTDLTKDDFEVTVSRKRQELQQAVFVRSEHAAVDGTIPHWA